MSEHLLNLVVGQIVTLAVGAIAVWVKSLFSAVMEAKKDLDVAHEKIRNLESRLECAERSLYFDGE